MAAAFKYNYVDQGVSNLNKVMDYIKTGMDTTISVAQDMLDGETERSGSQTGPMMEEMRTIMKGFCQMERDVQAVLQAVDQTKQQAKSHSSEDKIELDKVFDDKLNTLKKADHPSFDEHTKVIELDNQMQAAMQADGSDLPPPSVSAPVASGDDSDVEVELTQQSVSTKCPYTGKEMKHPVKNIHCGHSYDRDGINQLIQHRGNRAKCPVAGCINQRPLEASHLEDNRELKRWMDHKKRGAGKKSSRK